MRIILQAAVIACCVSSHPSHAQTSTTETISYGAWRISSFRNSGTGQFSSCVATARYQSGIYMTFMITNRLAWSIGFGHPSWNFTNGQTVNLQFYIDNYTQRSGTATAIGKDLVNMPLPDNVQLFQQMRSGQQLYVNAANQNFQFRLNGTSVVLQSLLRCANSSGSDLTAQAPQPAPPPPPVAAARPATPQPAQSGPTADQRLEATQFVANLLTESGMRGVRLLTSSEVRSSSLPQFFQASDVVWRADGVLGSLRVLTGRSVALLDAMASEIIADDGRNCRGEFASGRTADNDLPDIRRVQTFCSNSGGRPATFAYMLLPMPGGLVYQLSTLGMTVAGEPDRQVTTTEDSRLRDAVRSVVLRDATPPRQPPTSPMAPRGAAGGGKL